VSVGGVLEVVLQGHCWFHDIFAMLILYAVYMYKGSGHNFESWDSSC